MGWGYAFITYVLTTSWAYHLMRKGLKSHKVDADIIIAIFVFFPLLNIATIIVALIMLYLDDTKDNKFWNKVFKL